MTAARSSRGPSLSRIVLPICYFLMPPSQPDPGMTPVNINMVWGFSDRAPQTLVPPNVWFLRAADRLAGSGLLADASAAECVHAGGSGSLISASLPRLDVRVFRDLAPLVDLALDIGREFLRRVADKDRALARELVLHLGASAAPRPSPCAASRSPRRGRGRCDQAVPVLGLDLRQTDLAGGRHIGQRRHALAGCRSRSARTLPACTCGSSTGMSRNTICT